MFWIQLPLVSAYNLNREVPSATPPAEAAEDPARITGSVLVVDGDPLVAAGMEQAIAGWGGSVLLAANREEALRCCRREEGPPDVVICNVELPGGIGGIALAQALRREFEHMGMLLVSADAGEDVQAAARGAGFPLLRQPVPPGRLRAALRHLLAVRTG